MKAIALTPAGIRSAPDGPRRRDPHQPFAGPRPRDRRGGCGAHCRIPAAEPRHRRSGCPAAASLFARGDANLETHEPRRLDQPFRIGSITKTMYGTVILQLADEGRLSVTDPIAKSVPRLSQCREDHHRRPAPHAQRHSGFLDAGAPPEVLCRADDGGDRRRHDRAGGEGCRRLRAPGRATIYTNVNFGDARAHHGSGRRRAGGDRSCASASSSRWA